MALTLKAAIGADDTVFDVNGDDALSPGDLKSLGSETIEIRTANPATVGYLETPYYRVSVNRGSIGSTKASHALGDTLGTASFGGGAGVTVDNGTDPPAEVTTIVAPGAVIAGDEATLAPYIVYDAENGNLEIDGTVNFRWRTNDVTLNEVLGSGMVTRNDAGLWSLANVGAGEFVFYAEHGNGVYISVGNGQYFSVDALAGSPTYFQVEPGGAVLMPSLPTADPVNAGQLWNDTGTLKVSAG